MIDEVNQIIRNTVLYIYKIDLTYQFALDPKFSGRISAKIFLIANWVSQTKLAEMTNGGDEDE